MQEADKNKMTIADVNDAFGFLRAITVQKKELFQGEVERERLQSLCEAFEQNTSEKGEKYSKSKKEQENYIQIMQALCIRYLCRHVYYCRQNMIMHDVIKTIQQRHKNTEFVEGEIKNLKSLLQSKSSKNSSSKLALSQNETSVLSVKLRNSNREVVLYKGQLINTPMGIAKISSINTLTLSVVFDLPFGKMYSVIARVVCWGGSVDALDATSDASLLLDWSNHKSFDLSYKNKKSIRDLLGPYEVEEDDVTDEDESVSNDESSHTNEEDQGIASGLRHVLNAASADEDVDFENIVSTADTIAPRANIFPITSQSSKSISNVRKNLYDPILDSSINSCKLPLAFAPISKYLHDIFL